MYVPGRSRHAVTSVRLVPFAETRVARFLPGDPAEIVRRLERSDLRPETQVYEVVVRGRFPSPGQGGLIGVSRDGDLISISTESEVPTSRERIVPSRGAGIRDVRLTIHARTGAIVTEEFL